MKYISRMAIESFITEIPEKNVMCNTRGVEALFVGMVTVRSYSVIYRRTVTSMNTFP